MYICIYLMRVLCICILIIINELITMLEISSSIIFYSKIIVLKILFKNIEIIIFNNRIIITTCY